MTEETPKRVKGVYVGAPAIFKLELAIQTVCEAFGVFNCYLVGSSLKRADWRDVDVRMIMEDEDFAKQFPNAGNQWQFDAKWLLLTVAISDWLSKQTGLPVDFQFQPQTHANEMHKGVRNAIGFRIAKQSE